MRLLPKTAIIIAAALAIATAANMVLVSTFVQPTFLFVDRQHAEEDHERVRDAIAIDLKSVSDQTQDWSHWDELYSHMEGQKPKFRSENMRPEHMLNMGLATGALLSNDFRILYQVNVDRASGAALPPLFPGDTLPAGWRARFTEGEFVGKSSVAQIGQTKHLTAIAPIVHSDGSGPQIGWLVFAHPVNDSYIKALAERMKVEVALLPADSLKLRGSTPTLALDIASRSETDKAYLLRSVMSDHAGAPAIQIKTSTPRSVKILGDNVLLWTSLGLISIGVLAAFGGAALINIMVIRPVSVIERHMSIIGEKADLSARLDETRPDEFGLFAQRLNHMVSELDSARKTLLAHTYASGMADIAADMLHNIRNTMGPIPTAIWKGSQSLKELRFDRLAQAADALAQDGGDASRKAKFAEYLKSSTQKISEVCRNAEAEFATISECAQQIELVMQNHDELSRGERLLETGSIFELIKNAACLTKGTGCEVVISPNVAKLPVVPIQRSALQQVLNNLIMNATQSIDRANRTDGRIVVDGQEIKEALEITIADNGAGINPNLIQNIFQRGFTTHSGSGIGLHSAASSLGAMNGTISAFSEGLGTGATFRITLPKKPSEEKAA